MRWFHPPQERLETPRLILRGWKMGDLQAYVRFASDPQVTMPAGSPPVTDSAQGETELTRMVHDANCYAIVLRETGEVIGKIRLQPDAHRGNNRDSLSVGYQLSRAFWGRGLMPEALWAIVGLAFERKGARVLGISHFPENSRSRRVIEKCGFRYEATLERAYLRYDGAVFDDVCYVMTREEYFRRKAGETAEVS